MMFPDTSNDQQLAALRRTAERFRTAGNTRAEFARATLKPFAPTRESFNSGDAFATELYALATEELSLASR
jgi:hypothetical protein